MTCRFVAAPGHAYGAHRGAPALAEMAKLLQEGDGNNLNHDLQRAALGASRRPVEFGKMSEALSELSLPYSNGVAFEFSVHVIVFEKPGEASK
jgi:hypothetical protein